MTADGRLTSAGGAGGVAGHLPRTCAAAARKCLTSEAVEQQILTASIGVAAGAPASAWRVVSWPAAPPRASFPGRRAFDRWTGLAGSWTYRLEWGPPRNSPG